jgi:hypothetical protein
VGCVVSKGLTSRGGERAPMKSPSSADIVVAKRSTAATTRLESAAVGRSELSLLQPQCASNVTKPAAQMSSLGNPSRPRAARTTMVTRSAHKVNKSHMTGRVRIQWLQQRSLCAAHDVAGWCV